MHPASYNTHSEISQTRSWLLPTGYVLVVALALVWLFRDFLFSDGMLASHDTVAFGVFYRELLRDSLFRTGGVPLWNPYICCGVPFVDAVHGGIFYPLTLIDLIGRIYRGIGYNFILHYLLAAVFMYLAARQAHLSRLSASCAGIAYALSPCLVSWVAPGHEGKLYVAAWFPLLILFLDRLLQNRRLFDIGAFGLVYGIILLTPHYQLAYYASWAVLLYAVFILSRRALRERSLRGAGLSALAVIAATVIGIGISAIQLVPSATYLPVDSPRTLARKGTAFASLYALHEGDFVAQAVPEFTGQGPSTERSPYWGKNGTKDNSESIGIVPLLLSLLALIVWRKSEVWFWTALAFVTALYAAGPMTPLFGLLVSSVPFLDAMAGPSSSMFIFVFCIALLAGYGVQAVENRSASRDRDRRRIRPTALGIVPAMLLLFAIAVSVPDIHFLKFWATRLDPSLLSSDAASTARWAAAQKNLPSLRLGAWLAFAYSTAAVAVIWIGAKLKRPGRVLFVLLLLILAANIGFDGRFIHVFNYNRRFGDHPIIDILKAHNRGNRTAPYHFWESAFQFGHYGLASTIGYDGKEPLWYFELIGRGLRSNALNPRLANLLGTRFVVSDRHGSLGSNALGPIPLDTLGGTDQYVVLENDNSFPHVFFVDSCIVTPDPAAIRAEILHGPHDLRRTAFLEVPPRNLPEAVPTGPATAHIETYENDRVTIAVSTDSARLLILTDTWYRDWTAAVDGVSSPVYRADAALRAVVVPGGGREVVFTYVSPRYRFGRSVTWFSLALVALLFVGSPLLKRFRT